MSPQWKLSDVHPGLGRGLMLGVSAAVSQSRQATGSGISAFPPASGFTHSTGATAEITQYAGLGTDPAIWTRRSARLPACGSSVFGFDVDHCAGQTAFGQADAHTIAGLELAGVTHHGIAVGGLHDGIAAPQGLERTDDL